MLRIGGGAMSRMKTLLIVEDDTDIQDYYQILLSGLGVRILRAHTGKQGLAFVDAGEDIDLILLDIVLPEMGGEEFFRELRLVRQVRDERDRLLGRRKTH